MPANKTIFVNKYKYEKNALNYIPMTYRNIDNSDCYKPHHVFERQIIFYK